MQHGPAVQALCAQSQTIAESLLPQNLANTAWAFAQLASDDAPLMAALSACALQRMSEFDVQPLVGLVDLGARLPDYPAFLTQMRPLVAEFVRAMPGSLERRAWRLAQV